MYLNKRVDREISPLGIIIGKIVSKLWLFCKQVLDICMEVKWTVKFFSFLWIKFKRCLTFDRFKFNLSMVERWAVRFVFLNLNKESYLLFFHSVHH